MTAWYIARAGGIVAFALLTAAVVVGLLLSGRSASKRWPKFALEDVHRFLGILVAVFIGVHALGLLLDSYLPFSIRDLVVPGTAPYRHSDPPGRSAPNAGACGCIRKLPRNSPPAMTSLATKQRDE